MPDGPLTADLRNTVHMLAGGLTLPESRFCELALVLLADLASKIGDHIADEIGDLDTDRLDPPAVRDAAAQAAHRIGDYRTNIGDRNVAHR